MFKKLQIRYNFNVMKKSLKIFLIITGIVLYTVLVVILTLVGFLAYLMYYSVTSSTIKDIGEYNTCLNKIENKSLVEHFPGEIPKEAKNPKLYCYPQRYESDGALVLLAFETDEKYITNELQKLTDKNNNSELSRNVYPIASEKVGIPEEDLTFYFLEDTPQRHKNNMPYFGGIATDENKTEILYYYFLPGD